MTLINHITKDYTYRNGTLAVVLGCLCLASCAEDPGRASASDVPAIFTPFISETGVTGELSRAANDRWDAEDRVGIYMVEHVSESETNVDLSTALSANVEYKTSSGGTSSELVAVNNVIRYPSNGDAVNFVAYYPYSGDTHVSHNHIYKVDVSDQIDLPAIDLLYHNGIGTAYSRTSTVVGLVFKHKLSKILIQVIPASEDIDVDLTGTTASLVGFPTTADFNLGSGVLSNPGDAATEDTPIDLVNLLAGQPSSADCASFQALVVPTLDNDAFTRTIQLAIDGESYNYTLPPTATLGSGRAYSYTFKFTGNKLVLVHNTIVDWDGSMVTWGDYLLTASKIYFDIPQTSSTGHTVMLSTNAPSAPVISYSEDTNNASENPPTWMHASLSEATVDENGWNNYTLTFDADFNLEAAIRTGYIRLEIEGLVLPIRVTQDAGRGMYVDDPQPAVFENVSEDGKTGNTFTIETNAQDEEIVVNTTNTDMIINLNTSRGAVANDGSSIWTITFDVTTNTTALIRTGNIEVTLSGITKIVQVSQKAARAKYEVSIKANCYMVNPGAANFVFSPFDAVTKNDKPMTSTFTIRKLWDDTGAVQSISINNGIGAAARITVVPTSTPGNAVIAVYDGETIMWSYHIWVVDYDPETVNWVNNGFTVMDCNLGATKASMGYGLGTGLFYQWGRKDPFPAVDKVAEGEWMTRSRTALGTVTIETSILNPNTFITSNNDWLTLSDSFLWTEQEHYIKYNPCPNGWTVPTFLSIHQSPWSILTAAHWDKLAAGYNLGTNALIPACGGRVNTTGRNNVWNNSRTLQWSSHEALAQVLAYAFTAVTVNDVTVGSLEKAHGFSIRCIKKKS